MIFCINQLAFFGPLGGPEILLILLIGILVGFVGVLPFWFICKKAGFSPWLSLLTLIPFGAIVLPFILAFTPWTMPASQNGNS
jgi:H+/Cl- antiporter ClcA